MKLFSIIAVILSFSTLPSDVFQAQKYRMDGKYGLYVRLNDQNWDISWMTSVGEEGQVFSSMGGEKKLGNTSTSTIHKFQVPVGTQKIKFGGEQSGFNELRLNVDFDRAPFDIKGVDSIYVFGDTHGNFDYVTELLKTRKIVDEELKWIGGKKHLVFVGDILDRGKDALRLAWFIYGLETDALAKGGRVHLVLGNHEIMVMSNDVRYVSAKEKQIANLYSVPYRDLFHPHKTLIGRWLTSKPAVLKIDNVIFTHGGLIVDQSIKDINDQTYSFLQKQAFTYIKDEAPDLEVTNEEELNEIKDFFYNSYSPFWYRGYVQTDTTGRYLDYILTKNKGKLHVVGHTSRPNIEERFKGKLIATNVDDAGSELLLLVRKKKKYVRFRIDLEGNIKEL